MQGGFYFRFKVIGSLDVDRTVAIPLTTTCRGRHQSGQS